MPLQDQTSEVWFGSLGPKLPLWTLDVPWSVTAASPALAYEFQKMESASLVVAVTVIGAVDDGAEYAVVAVAEIVEQFAVIAFGVVG